MLTLDQHRAAFQRHRFLAMPLAGLIVWTILGVLALFLPFQQLTLAYWIGTGGIVYLGLFLRRFTGELAAARQEAPNPFDRLFFQAQFMALLVFAIAIPFFLIEPHSQPLSLGILSGLMWVPMSWMLQHWIGIAHAVIRTLLVLLAWYLFPEQSFVAISVVIVAVYLFSIVVMEQRYRRVQAA
jgi:uncharacterized membrane protein